MLRGSWALSGKQRDTGPDPYYMSSGGVFSYGFRSVFRFFVSFISYCVVFGCSARKRETPGGREEFRGKVAVV